jgi:hypothetical protein
VQVEAAALFEQRTGLGARDLDDNAACRQIGDLGAAVGGDARDPA